jgi:membrane fusion protein (multidrug efflux system)
MFSKKLVSSEANEKVQFDLETQRAAYELARLDLNYTNITAPIDGVISERLVKEGNLIQLHQTLFRIDDFDPLLAILNVPERELMTLKPGLVAEMEVDALPKTRFQGKVARISPVVDAKTGTFRVTCEFSDRSGQLKSGMFGRVEIVFDRRAEALTIPRTALIDEDGQTSVFVVEMGKAVVKDSGDKKKDGADKAAAAKAAPAEEKVEVREGLKDGERVVTVGRAALRDGTQVQVLESKP